MRAVAPDRGGVTEPESRRYAEVKRGYTSFVPGDVIMAKITPCMENGKTAVVPETSTGASFGSTEFHTIRPENGVLAQWVAHFLLQPVVRRFAQRQMSGAVGQMRVPAAFFESLNIPLPSTAEQRRIIDALEELFSDVNAGAGALHQAQSRLSAYRASLLKAAVDGSLSADWRDDSSYAEPATVLLDRILTEHRAQWEAQQLAKFETSGVQPPSKWRSGYKEPTSVDSFLLRDPPSGWCWAAVDQISVIQGGIQKTPARTPRQQHYPYLRVANVLRGRLDLTELHRFELTREELSRLRLQPGDLLVVEGNGSRSEIGRCAIWKGEIENCVHQNHIIRIRPLSGVLPEYLIAYLNSPFGQKAIQDASSSTSGLNTLSIAKIGRLPVPLPPIAEQEAIVEIVEDQLSVIDHLETDLEEKLTSAQALKQSILRHAFTGKLVPQDPTDEPASELLKRIAAERESRNASAKPARRRARKKA